MYKEPENPSAHLLNSTLYAVEKNPDQAIAEARKAIEKDPKK